MSPEAAVQESIGRAREDVASAGLCLLSPTLENVERCRAALERAIPRLEEVNRVLGDGPAAVTPAARAELLALRTDSRRLSRLLEHAATFHLGRLYAVCGYTEQGEPAMPRRLRRLSLEA